MTRQTQIVTHFAGGEVSDRLRMRTDSPKYNHSCQAMLNFILTKHGTAFYRAGSEHVSPLAENITRTITWHMEDGYDIALVLTDREMRIWRGTTQVNMALTITTPWLDVDLFELHFVQDESTMYFTHARSAPQQLVRVDDASWTFGPVAFVNPPQYFFADGVSPAPTDEVQQLTLAGTWNTGNTFTLQIEGGGSTSAIQYGASQAATAANIQTALNALYYIPEFGIVNIFTVTAVSALIFDLTIAGSFPASIVTDFTVVSGAGTGSLSLSAEGAGAIEAAWSDARGWPQTCEIHEQRLLLACTTSLPAFIWGSRIGTSNDMTTGPNDADGLSFRLKSSAALCIKWLKSRDALLVGTSGGEYVQLAVPFTPTNVDFKNQTRVKSSALQAVELHNDTFYVERGARNLRLIKFDDAVAGYQSHDVTWQAEHITRTGLRQLAVSQQSEPIVWGVTTEGVLVGLTYELDNEILGWHRHIVAGGRVESCTVIHNGTEDELWLVVVRNGVRSLERVPYLSRAYRDDALGADGVIATEPADYDLFADAAVVIEFGTPQTEVTGLGHLEGETVVIAADHAVVPGGVVSAGAISLTDPASHVVVGRGYTGTLHTFPPDPGGGGSTYLSFDSSRWTPVSVKLEDSHIPKINGVLGRDRATQDLMGTEVDLVSDFADAVDEGYDDGSVLIETVSPLPCHVTGIAGILGADFN